MKSIVKPVIVMLMYDPQGLLFPHLAAVEAQLKALFAHAFLSVGPATRTQQSDQIDRIADDPFFKIVEHSTNLPVGEDLRSLYKVASETCPPETILHLCFLDRVAFALQSVYQTQFVQDIQSLQPGNTPLIFQRSQRAWDFHPDNYRQLEQIVTQVGELLYRQEFDFAWCHLAVQSGQLRSVLPSVTESDFSVCAELVLLLKDSLSSRDVDWLAWEDPFLLGRDGEQLKREREQDTNETRKRLHYVLPMLEVLYERAGGYQWTGSRAESSQS